jgi:hypothetical protein
MTGPARKGKQETIAKGGKSMKNKSHRTTWRRARIALAAAGATTIMTTGNVATATGDGSFTISGNSTFSDCGAAGSDFALLFTGDLMGCLSIFVQGYTCKEVNGFAHYTERGREAFVGTWRGKQGRFTTKYTVDAAYATGFCQSFDYSLELSGSCIHKIQGRSGVFANVEGVYTMFDVITNVTGDPVTGEFKAGSGANNFLYAGRIQYAGWPTADAGIDGATWFDAMGDAEPLDFGFADRGVLEGRGTQGRRC